MNDSGIRVVEYNVLVKPKELDEKTPGGLILPDEVKEKDEFGRTEGVLIGMSPMAFANSDWPKDREDEKPKVGDTVIFSKYNATKVERNGGEYWIMKDTDIAGVIEE